MRAVVPAIALHVALGALTLSGPAAAQATAAVQLHGLSQADADRVIAKVTDAQRQLRADEPVYFELLSGAPASYAQTRTAPRDAFLSLPLGAPFSVEDRTTGNPLWRPYRLQIVGPDSLVWQVDVVLGVNDRVERVEILARPPHPF